jgi:uncharacterized protein
MTTKLTSGTRRTAVLLSTAVASLVAATAVASAHVTVNPNTAQQGSYTKVSFRVPNEEKDQSTTSIEVDLPADHPIASVSVKPVPGWTATATKSTLPTPIKTDDGDVTEAVTKLVWTGGKIDPGQFQEFDVSMGPLPKDTDQLVFKALQTYSDGNVVRWIDVPQAGQAEPDHPAPVLHLTKAAASGAATPSAPSSSPSVALSASSESGTKDDSDTAARTLGIAGLVVGVLGFGTALVALRRKNTAGS